MFNLPIITRGKPKQFVYDGVTYDSISEIWFKWYLEELRARDYLLDYEYQPPSIGLSAKVQYPVNVQMKTKVKESHRSLLPEHSYRPDYRIVWSEKADGVFYMNIESRRIITTPFVAQEHRTLIEVKPKFDVNNMTRLFRINQKWIYEQYQTYVQAIICVPDIRKGEIVKNKNALFNVSFCPERYRFTDMGIQFRKGTGRYQRIDEFLSERMNNG